MASRRTGTGLACFAEVIALLVKQPRSNIELVEARGQENDNGQVGAYLKALRAEGLIYIKRWIRGRNGRSRFIPVWAWQPSVLHFPDAPHPLTGADDDEAEEGPAADRSELAAVQAGV